jgi:hypothetical protein
MHHPNGLILGSGLPVAPVFPRQFLDHPARFPQQVRRGAIHVLHEHVYQAEVPATGLGCSGHRIF